MDTKIHKKKQLNPRKKQLTSPLCSRRGSAISLWSRLLCTCGLSVFRGARLHCYVTSNTHRVIDAHTHIDDVLNRLRRKSLDWNWNRLHSELILGNQPHAVTVCCERDTWEDVLHLLNSDTSDMLRGAFALHPSFAHHWCPEFADMLCQVMEHPKVVALGECGLDYYRQPETGVQEYREHQKKVFIEQIEIALRYNKPLMTHLREADGDAFEILQKHVPKDYPVHIHCCTSPKDFVVRV
uniref:Putative deoxyribonuclease TATDN2 n=1 Tax=Lygus hesperus TaxID=30085 RepID=A0A0A9XZM5_LYGHE